MNIKISGGLNENGVIAGNTYDKYGSRNPVVRWLMNGFDNALSELVRGVSPKTIHEIGCGEGYWVLRWNMEGFAARGTDFSLKITEIAQANAIKHGFSPDLFNDRSIYDLDTEKDSADLVVCIEVLEHLEYPEEGLVSLSRIAKPYIIISVPREPIWRVLNIVRGKYVFSFGNTPGHIQHWSKNKFIRLIDKYFSILQVKNPLPWTMVLCRSCKQQITE